MVRKKSIDVVVRPDRPADHISKRGIPYWFAPDWCRDLNGVMCRIRCIKTGRSSVALYMVSKAGKTSYIQGSIQREFQQWHADRQIDLILLGEDPDDVYEYP